MQARTQITYQHAFFQTPSRASEHMKCISTCV